MTKSQIPINDPKPNDQDPMKELSHPRDATGHWSLGHWTLIGIWDLGFGIWDLGFGLWDLGFGIWSLGFGHWSFKQKTHGSAVGFLQSNT
jgi:hypothetical protein